LSYPIYLAFKHQPDLVPYPFHGFHFSWTFLIIAFDSIGLALLTVIGIVVTVGVGLASAHLGGNRFPLPTELRRHGFAYDLMISMRDGTESELDRARTSAPEGALGTKPVAANKLSS
jgi:hypothetical protein